MAILFGCAMGMVFQDDLVAGLIMVVELDNNYKVHFPLAIYVLDINRYPDSIRNTDTFPSGLIASIQMMLQVCYYDCNGFII
jgi:hypothetical protein